MSAAAVDRYDFWRRALAGERVGTDLPIHEGEPQPGFYRKRTGKAKGYVPVALWEQDGKIVGVANLEVIDPVEVWTYCCRAPITEKQYWDRVNTGKWHDEDEAVAASIAPPPAGHNQADKVDSLKDQIESALQGVADYAEVKDDATAAKAQSLRSRLLELHRDADKERDALKRPHLEAGQAVDAIWQPIVKSAKAGADAIKKALDAHETAKFRAEQAAIAAQRAKDAEEAARHAPIAAEPEAPPAPIPAPVAAAPLKGAYGRGAARKVVKTAVVKDQDAAYAHFKAQPEVVSVLQMLSQRMVTAGFQVPGVEIIEEIKVV